MPTSIRITPTVCRSMPETCAVTAYFRIAPTAIRRIDGRLVISAGVPPGPAAEPSATPASDDGSILRGATVVARQPAGPRVQASVARSASPQGAHLNPASEATAQGAVFPMRVIRYMSIRALLLAALVLPA